MLYRILLINATLHFRSRRPFMTSDVKDLGSAEKWRRQIVREITKKVAAIQNAGLGEHRIRDINDQINKLMREKGHWQKRIRELGGADYGASAPRAYDADGRELGVS
jgi:pre-mRNA-splicing factor ISY1